MCETLTAISPLDKRRQAQVDALLEQEGVRRDGNLDYTCGIFDSGLRLIATGSCFANTLRCFAVSGSHQGEGLLNQIITHLIEVQYQRGESPPFSLHQDQLRQIFPGSGLL